MGFHSFKFEVKPRNNVLCLGHVVENLDSQNRDEEEKAVRNVFICVSVYRLYHIVFIIIGGF